MLRNRRESRLCNIWTPSWRTSTRKIQFNELDSSSGHASCRVASVEALGVNQILIGLAATQRKFIEDRSTPQLRRYLGRTGML
jgi:hypothetical protein